MATIDFRSLLQEETTLRWGFLDQESEACAVVSSRMELLYLNQACQALVPVDWFSRRCFEVLPHEEALCALDCPTIYAVQTADVITYCEENLRLDDGSLTLGTAVIPLQASDDRAKAVLLFRAREAGADPERFATGLLADAGELQARVTA